MKTFEYKAYDALGKARRGLVEAFSEKEARERLIAQSLFATDLSEAGAKPSAWRRQDSLNSSVRAMIYRELAILLRAGISLSNALQLLTETPELKNIRGALAQTHDAVRQGSSFAQSLERAGFAGPLERALVELGERTGALHEALFRLADHLEEQNRLRDRVKSALLYPAFVIVMSLLIMIFMLGVMMPRFIRMFSEARIPLPTFTEMVFAAGRILGLVLLFLPLAGLAGAALFRRLALHNRALAVRADQSRFRWPILGNARTALVNMRFAQTLALTLRSGLPLTDGMMLAARATASPWIEDLMTAQADAVRQGRTLAAALRAVPPLAGALPGWVQAGEASGDLNTLLDEAATRYRQQWDHTITRLLALLEPILILAIGLTVLLIALAILMPVLSLNNAIGR